MGKKNLAIYTLGRLRRRKNFPAAEGGRQIFWVDPWEVDPWVTKFSLPMYEYDTKVHLMRNVISSGLYIIYTENQSNPYTR